MHLNEVGEVEETQEVDTNAVIHSLCLKPKRPPNLHNRSERLLGFNFRFLEPPVLLLLVQLVQIVQPDLTINLAKDSNPNHLLWV